jgi:hypothetical protein
LFRVVDDVIGSYATDHLNIPSAAYSGDFCPEPLRDLHGESSDATRRTVYENALPGRHPCNITDTLKSGPPGDIDCSSRFKIDVSGFHRKPRFGCTRVLGKRAARASTEDGISRSEACNTLSDRLNLAGEIESRAHHARSYYFEKYASHKRCVVEYVCVERIHRRGANL